MHRKFFLTFLLFVLMLQSADAGHLHAQSGRPAPPADASVPLSLDEYRALLDEIDGNLLRVPRPEAILPWMQGKLDAVTAVEMAPDAVVEPVNLLRNVVTPQSCAPIGCP